MILADVHLDGSRIWLLPLLWGPVIYSLVSGYTLYIGRFTGWRIYSRKSEPSFFWINTAFYLIVVDILSYLILVR